MDSAGKEKTINNGFQTVLPLSLNSKAGVLLPALAYFYNQHFNRSRNPHNGGHILLILNNCQSKMICIIDHQIPKSRTKEPR